MDGQGTLTYPDGSYYVGGWARGAQEGQVPLRCTYLRFSVLIDFRGSLDIATMMFTTENDNADSRMALGL